MNMGSCSLNLTLKLSWPALVHVLDSSQHKQTLFFCVVYAEDLWWGGLTLGHVLIFRAIHEQSIQLQSLSPDPLNNTSPENPTAEDLQIILWEFSKSFLVLLGT